ncbi:helix-turn-helix domain-containing protein [Streptomyces sp. KM273126]|uniref:PucR family transcriptional regulator n=1 Tax=Streptomyces sp. KM273126 TaxID=2545247 RepID=UPI00103B6D85|nr:helix-turn-helix domain-containing protein [Streptomyces sp. KM273126]MBA2807659.1 helix-turn-helix domain-containing protein [Streptomyces sp. KM273126]
MSAQPLLLQPEPTGSAQPAPADRPAPVRPLLPGFVTLAELAESAAPTQSWAVLGVQALGFTDYALTRMIGRFCGTGVLVRLSGGRGHVLAPAGDRQQALRLARRMRAELGDAVWISVTWRPFQELAGGVREAEDVLRIVCALGRRPGVHQLDDVAVEFAVVSNPEVSRRLTALIEPVVSRPELLRTLEALIAADGNRARAAADLVIHRSTIDYRLGRIEALTGHSPVRVRGLQTLCTALAAHTLARPRSASASDR